MINLTPSELARYSRHALLPEIGVEGQTKLRNSRVLVVGAGGLGSPAALYLAAAGVGTIGIADFDTVEPHNLHRQLLHSDDRIGQRKVDSAATRLRETNPHVDVRTHFEGITADNAVALFSEYDAIVDGTDNFPTRYLNNDAAARARRPLVFGSVYRFEGQVSVFAPHLGGPCYRCLFPEAPPPGSVPGCGEVGVLGALCGVIGSLQALEAIKILVGMGEPLMGRLLTYDALSQSFSTMAIQRSSNCHGCDSTLATTELDAANYLETCAPPPSAQLMNTTEHPLEITIGEAHRLLKESTQTTALIDVREPHETRICCIEGAELVPMRQIPESLHQLSREKHLLILCHHGGRSMRVTQFLRDQGFSSVSNISGGIDAWAREIEPEMLRY